MRPYYEDGSVTIYHGDCREVLPAIEGVETCITDPPYGLSFMGKGWDHAVPDESYWRRVAAALKPGASVLAFGGTRLWHWLTVGMERGGLEIRDCLMWLYGSGFPKSLDISKAIDKAAGVEFSEHPAEGVGFMRPDGRGGYNVTKHQLRREGDSTEAAKLWNGWGTALKPAWEPIVLAMKPLDGTFAQNALEHGVAGLNVDGARIGTDEVASGNGALGRNAYGRMDRDPSTIGVSYGRWPANLVLDEDAAAMLDEQSGERTSGRFPSNTGGIGTASGIYGDAPGREQVPRTMDSGGASRFFYTAKASRSDRGEGNDHPTVKPSDLMKWLVTLTATPTGGTVLDPFMGSGTTVYAAKEMGRKAIGIELDEQWCEVAAQRCSQEVLAL